jgi:Tfp pilus assembly protein PilV
MRDRRRRGSALLEVMISLVVLGSSGVAMLALLGQTSRTMRSARDTEREVRQASAELDRFVMYDRATLIAFVGRSMVRGWTLDVTQPAAELFDVAISRDGAAPLLRTTFYRPDTTDAGGPP